MNNGLLQFIKSMPKIDLHCHLDGSFSTDFVRKAAGLFDSDSELLSRLQAPDICSGLSEYLERFDLPISCIQTPENITAGVYDVVKNASAEGVRYIEIRFAPTCSVNEVQGYSDIYEAAIKGCELAKQDTGCDSAIIVCAMRHHGEEENLAVLNSAMDFLHHGVCALDLAGDEAAFPNKEFKYLFDKARSYNMPFTIHSGECHSVDNVRFALEAGASRVGHGIALSKDPLLMTECKRKRLGLELCPISNYQTRAVTENEIYPLRTFLDAGLPATINTDNRTVSNTSLVRELTFVVEKCGITENDIVQMYKNSIEISFANDDIKHKLSALL